jgi:hypothetical protein
VFLRLFCSFGAPYLPAESPFRCPPVLIIITRSALVAAKLLIASSFKGFFAKETGGGH